MNKLIIAICLLLSPLVGMACDTENTYVNGNITLHKVGRVEQLADFENFKISYVDITLSFHPFLGYFTISKETPAEAPYPCEYGNFRQGSDGVDTLYIDDLKITSAQGTSNASVLLKSTEANGHYHGEVVSSLYH